MLRLLRILFRLGFLGLFLAAVGGVVVAWMLKTYSVDLPDIEQLANYEPPVVTRLHAGDGRLLAEYAIDRRVFVPVEAIPNRVRNAFISAEDQNFYDHPGIDIQGIARAAFTNVSNLGSGRRLVGASTITQQVTKNFLLTNEVSLDRKIREMILAFRIERVYEKDEILELYLNEIYLGFGSYGVASAALEYFNKSLDELTVAEAAYLAALPKAPANYHPVRRYDAAIERRDWVINRMLEDGVLTGEESAAAMAEPLVVVDRQETEFVSADFFAEEVRRELLDEYGESGLYEGGLTVRTTLDPVYQEMANIALRDGLNSYDRRHGWRGPVASLEVGDDWPGEDWVERLNNVRIPIGLHDWSLAVVLRTDGEAAEIGFRDGATGAIPLSALRWAREYRGVDSLGPEIHAPSDVVGPGHVISVSAIVADSEGNPVEPGGWRLEQIPRVEGAVVVIDPHTGRVLAMVGGYSEFVQNINEFNRATQAERQPGSAFKPFVYLTALDNGFTPASLVLDAPFVIDQGPGLGKWRPQNYGRQFYGPSTLRTGLERSRNVMTVRLAQRVGMEQIADVAARFGIDPDMPLELAQALGAGETTVLRLTAAYSMLANGGRRVEATLIDRVQDRNGNTIFRQDRRPCAACAPGPWAGQEVPRIPDTREQIDDSRSIYQVVSMLEGVIQRGTGVVARGVGRPLAGKTGTTNDSIDAWFMGFSPDLVVGVWVGFDQPSTLGRREAGSRAAGPVFRDFMTMALADQPATPFRVPQGVTMIRVNRDTGLRTGPDDERAIIEVFKDGTDPTTNRDLVGGGLPENVLVTDDPTAGGPSTGTGGLY